MDENADAGQTTFELPLENWSLLYRLTTGAAANSLDEEHSFGGLLGVHEARDMAQNRPLWRLMSLHSARHSQWCMLLLDCMVLKMFLN